MQHFCNKSLVRFVSIELQRQWAILKSPLIAFNKRA